MSSTITPAQRNVMKQIASGMIIRKRGRGYWLHDANGKYVGKASIAVKSLALEGLVALAEDRIYFTTRGYMVWAGGEPKGEAARLVALADARYAWVQSMLVAPIPLTSEDERVGEWMGIK